MLYQGDETMSTLDDFFGSSDEPECLYCGKSDGKLEVSIRDEATGEATHWHHAECKAQAETKHAAEVAERNAETERNSQIAESDN
jgi:hypothetical protein